jgi:drug/metabolite transporter (DMT)-like permease
MGGQHGRILLIMLAAVVALTLGETALAKGMKQSARVGGDWTVQVLAVARNGWIAAGVALLGLHLALYLLALRRADLSFALPLTAASYPLSALLARFYLREDVGTARWLGTLLIAAGVAIVALGETRHTGP